MIKLLNTLQDNKILAMSKLEALADDKSNVIHNTKFMLHRVESIMGKGENADNQQFLPFFSQCFQKLFSPSEASIVVIVLLKGY